MKHTLKIQDLNGTGAHFSGGHELIPSVSGRFIGREEPFGPFFVLLSARMYREDWEAAGRPVELEVDL